MEGGHNRSLQEKYNTVSENAVNFVRKAMAAEENLKKAESMLFAIFSELEARGIAEEVAKIASHDGLVDAIGFLNYMQNEKIKKSP